MTEQEWHALAVYVSCIASKLELRDWTITVNRRPCDDGAYATIYPTYGRKVADVHFVENFRDLDRDVQRHTVVHELVHCHLESAANMVYRDVEAIVGKPADLVFYSGFKRQMEYGVDGLATALAQHMPHIVWPE